MIEPTTSPTVAMTMTANVWRRTILGWSASSTASTHAVSKPSASCPA